MKTAEIVWQGIVSFVGVLVIDYLWHMLVFGGFYNSHAEGFANLVDGKAQPLIGYSLIADFLFAAVLVLFVGRYVGKVSSKSTMKDGAILGALVAGVFAFSNNSLIPSWTFGLSLMELLFGALVGLVVGWLFTQVSRSKATTK